MAEGGEGTTNKTCFVRKTNTYLPADLFTEILSWLPVQSILVTKCVCKEWKSITEETSFIKKHMNQASTIILFRAPEDFIFRKENNFKYFRSSEGLVLERGAPFSYRIKNPATRQVLRLPDTVKKPGYMYFHYVSGSMVYKLIYLHAKGLGSRELVCEILTVGDDLAWRGLNMPTLKNIYEGNSRVCFGLCHSGIFYITKIAIDGLSHSEIVILDLATECVSCFKIPRKVFWDWNNVYPLMWKGKLSLNAIVEDKVIVWVLEDNKINQWADRVIVIPLTSAKYFLQPGNKVRAYFLSGSILYIYASNRINISYDIEEKKVKSVGTSPLFQNSWFKWRPCLVQLKGMHAEEESMEG